MLWELVGAGWRGHRHDGTLRDQDALVFFDAPVSRRQGWFEATLPEHEPFDRISVSLNPHFSWNVGAFIRVRVRARVGDAWTPWAPLGVYGDGDDLPTSEVGPDPARIEVRLDTAYLPRLATRAELRFEAGVDEGRSQRFSAVMGGGGIPTERDDRHFILLARAAVLTWHHAAPVAIEVRPQRHPAWGRLLPVVPRSATPPLAWPAAAAMIVGPERAADVDRYGGWPVDHGAGGHMNPSVLVEFLSSALGFLATGDRFVGFGPLEDEVAAGRPVIVATSTAAPSPSPAVVCGFTESGDVVVSDPVAGPAPSVIRRPDLARRWLGDGDGLAWTFVPP